MAGSTFEECRSKTAMNEITIDGKQNRIWNEIFLCYCTHYEEYLNGMTE